MGQSYQTKIQYKTKDGIPISYLYYDIKGKDRFPSPPSQNEINRLFQQCMRDIVTTPEQNETIKKLESKYKFRFVLLHNKKITEQKEKFELNNLRNTNNDLVYEDCSMISNTKEEIDALIEEVQSNEKLLKVALLKLSQYIDSNNAYEQFIKMGGIQRILNLLMRAVVSNKQGTKINFSNQIQLLKFLKNLSQRSVKSYYAYIAQLKKYAETILSAYHPVNVAVTAYVVIILEDYVWHSENNDHLFTVLDNYKRNQNNQSILTPFANTIEQTDNILMCYYNIKFINELLAAIVEEDRKILIQNQIIKVQYDHILENVKEKLEKGAYQIDKTTFIHLHQMIYKYATMNKKKQKSQLPVHDNEQKVNGRQSMNFLALQNHLLFNFVQTTTSSKIEEKKQSDQLLTVTLGENDKKQFNKFLLDTLNQVEIYFRLETYIDPDSQQKMEKQEFSQEIIGSKVRKRDIQEYFKRIGAACVKNNCNEILMACFKNLQHFDRSQWKRLDQYIMEDIGGGVKLSDELQSLKKQFEQKEIMVKRLIKDNVELKAQLIQKPSTSENHNISKLSTTLYSFLNQSKDDKVIDKAIENKDQSTKTNSKSNVTGHNPLTNNAILPPPPSLTNNALLPPLPSQPSISNQILPPPPSLNTNSAQQNNHSLTNNAVLPPPPSLTNEILPPPPSLNNNAQQNISAQILPPPPSLNNNGPSPQCILPPPPHLNASVLPPPPILNTSGLPPPPLSTSLPSLPSLPGLPSLPSLPGLPGNVNISNEKKKEKRKPKVPLKPCNYKVLSYNDIENTIWSEVDDRKVKIDEQELESLFSKFIDKKAEEKVTSVIEVKKQAIKLLGSDRWRNVEIVLTKLKIPQGEMIKALTECSGKYANLSTLESIDKMMPSEDEQNMIQMYEGPVEQLGKPEKFFKEIMSVPEYKHRVKTMIFANTQEEFIYELESNMEHLITGFTSIKENYRLHYVLQVALAVGNYLNGTSVKGGAWGFKLDTLERMEDAKSSDNKMNAAFYVIDKVWEKYEQPIFDKEEIDMYQFITKIPTSQINQQIGELRKYLNSIKKAYASKVQDNPKDEIGVYCEELMHETETKLKLFTEVNKKLQQAYLSCAKFYCEEGEKSSSDEIGKKLFKCILFISNSEKIYKMIKQQQKKQNDRKAIKNQMIYSETPKKIKQEDKINPEIKNNKDQQITTTKNMVLKPTVEPQVTKKEKIEEYSKLQAEKSNKALQNMMQKRKSKMIAVRESKKVGKLGKSQRNDLDAISFLKNIK